MPQRRGESPAYVQPCDYCAGTKGRNKQIVHILSQRNREALEEHLTEHFKGKPPQEFFLSLWDTAHMLYGTVAFQRNQPIALVYLEEHGVKVNNKLEWVTRHRGRI